MEAFITYKKVLPFPDTAEGSPEEFSTADFGRFLAFLAASKLPRCFFRGNEATLHSGFAKLVSMARKKKIDPHLETCGLIPEEVVDFLRDDPMPVFWRIYHPSLYSEAQRKQVVANCRTLSTARNGVSRAFALIHDLSQDLEYVRWFVHAVPLTSVMFQVLPPQKLEDLKRFTPPLVRLIRDLVRERVHVTVDCGVPPCAFSDSDYGLLMKLGVTVDKCLPRPGVLPGLRLYHCPQMTAHGCGSLLRHRAIGDVMDFFYRRNAAVQWDYRFFPRCDSCECVTAETCVGECMMIKMGRIRARIDELKPVAESEGGLSVLVELGTLYWEMRELANAKECLSEARRVDPADGYVHLLLGRVLRHNGECAEAEEEFQKASRLLPDPRHALFELGEMYHEQGQHKKAEELVKALVAGNEGKDAPELTPS